MRSAKFSGRLRIYQGAPLEAVIAAIRPVNLSKRLGHLILGGKENSMTVISSCLLTLVLAGSTFADPRYYERVHQRGEEKGYCDEKNEDLFERSRQKAMGTKFTIGCSDWSDQIEEFGFPDCQYKRAISERDCTVNPF